MSDLLGGGPSTPAGNERGGNGGSRVPPRTSGSPGIKGPREVMRDRIAREERRRREQEAKLALERRQAEEEARLLEEEKRRSAERRAAAAGAGGGQRGSGESAGQRISGGSGGQRLSDNSQRARRQEDRTSGERPQETLQGVGRGGRAMGGGEVSTSSRPRPAQPQQQSRPPQPEPIRTTQPEPTPAAPAPATSSTGTQPQTGPAPTTRSSFPHAFERWETLSAHWEGLTSFWIRRLEENASEINRDPLSQQLSRQVTDLSAAGANLFHAVVELQRLRASSERKFQRWFFETRAEQERAQEIQALTVASLEAERRGKEEAIKEAVAKERASSSVEKQLAEMRRELQIAKEEARRAWEELGRREQEERERTISLRSGQPTTIGGVQVVPMMQGVPTRQERSGDQATTTYTGGSSSAAIQDPEGPLSDPDTAYQQYSRSQRSEPNDPFVDMTQQQRAREREPNTPPATAGLNYASSASYSPQYSHAPAVQPTTASSSLPPNTSSSQFYQHHQGTTLHPVTTSAARSEPTASYVTTTSVSGAPSEGAFSEEEYEIDSQGQFIRDARGNKIRYQGVVSDNDSDEYEVTAERERELANLQRYGRVSGAGAGAAYGGHPSSSAGMSTAGEYAAGTTAERGDYESQAYSAPGGVLGQPGWEEYTARHHHPTRLSDVLEEDERSRTSASLVSRRE